MATVLEARAIITAEDKTGPAFAAIEARMAAMSKAAANIGRVAAPMAAGAHEMERVAAPIARATKALHDYNAAMSDAAARSRELAAAQKNVGAAIELGSRAASRAQALHKVKSIGATAGMMASPFIAHEAVRAAKSVVETYREYDKERRFGKAVMGISDAEQAPLVAQAIHGGGTTKYNDIQFLEAQRELAARGLNREQILGFMPSAANLGQSLDLSLPDSVRQMEGAIFGFKKDISSVAAAAASARQTADIQVKAAKISGMKPEDLTEVYKFGATPARLAGVSEATLLAFGAISKKANMGGDEAGVAFRALIASGESPTSGARTALRAAGLRYADYQKAPDHLAVAPFVADVAERYGVKLDQAAQSAIAKIFGDKSMISSPEKFAPAMVSALKEALSGNDAKSLKSIAGEAGRYRAGSMQGVDMNALISDLLVKLPGNLQLANAIFGPKQGARIANAFGDPDTFRHMLDELNNHSGGYAEKISTERMAGFDGAVSRFEGATKNFETAMGRSFDKPLTGGTNILGEMLQKFAELPDSAHRAAGELTALAAASVTVAGVLKALSILNRLDGGPGFKTPGVLGLGKWLFKGGIAASMAGSLWNMDEAGKNLDKNHSLIERGENWARKNLPWWMTDQAQEHFQSWQKANGGSHFIGDSSPSYSRDFTLGSSGSFSKLGRLQPSSNLGPMDKGSETITVTGGVEGKFELHAVIDSGPLVTRIDKLEQIVKQIPLSSTGHPNSSLGPSMPEAAPAGKSGGQ
jgi:TP901 family phage tail tape measure protein